MVAATQMASRRLLNILSDIAINLVEADAGTTFKASFADGETMPVKHGAEGDNASPMLEWSGAPEGTKSIVVIADDPDAAEPKPFVHWVIYDIPASENGLREGLPTDPVLQEPKGAKQGTNSKGQTGYLGPRPPLGDPAHHYHFQVFALDVETLGIDPGKTREAVLAAMDGHVLAKGEIVGLYQRPRVVLDAVPIIDALDRCDARFAETWWHWFFYAQPETPERVIMADPDAWYSPPASHLVSADALDLFRRAIRNPRVVHGMVEDYRAGLHIDRLHDEVNRAERRKIRCPTLVLWSERDDMQRLYGDPRSIWAQWVDEVLITSAIDCGHHVAEEAPNELVHKLHTFLRAPR